MKHTLFIPLDNTTRASEELVYPFLHANVNQAVGDSKEGWFKRGTRFT